MLYFEAIRALVTCRFYSHSRASIFFPVSRNVKPGPIEPGPAMDCPSPIIHIARLAHLPRRSGNTRSDIPVFAGVCRRWSPLQGNGLILLGVGSRRGLRRRRWFRLDSTGNGHIISALGTLDREAHTCIIDHHVLSARSAEKVDVHQSISGTSSAIGPNLCDNSTLFPPRWPEEKFARRLIPRTQLTPRGSAATI